MAIKEGILSMSANLCRHYPRVDVSLWHREHFRYRIGADLALSYASNVLISHPIHGTQIIVYARPIQMRNAKTRS